MLQSAQHLIGEIQPNSPSKRLQTPTVYCACQRRITTQAQVAITQAQVATHRQALVANTQAQAALSER